MLVTSKISFLRVSLPEGVDITANSAYGFLINSKIIVKGCIISVQRLKR